MIREAIRNRLKELKIPQMKCAADNELNYSSFNQFLKGRRAFPLLDIEKVFRYLELEIIGKPRKKINKKEI